jgi:hypothetical protein
VALALPFLESLPDRSAWAAGEEPVFSLFICTTGGVVTSDFFPAEAGALTQAGLTAAGKATSELSRHAEQLLFLRGIDFPVGTPGDSHIEGMCTALTARPGQGTSNMVTSTGPSADVVIASLVHPSLRPLTLFAGNANNAWAAESLSFASAGVVNQASDNPYTLYQEIVGLLDPGGGMSPEAEAAARRLALSRNSIHDLVRDDLNELLTNRRLSSADRQRLQLHFDSIRDVETGMGGTGGNVSRCSGDGLDTAELEALSEYTHDRRATDKMVKLHMSLVALAFACNYRRTATLQWGEPYDQTIYDVPSNERGWIMTHVSHRMQSDSSVGDDALAATAHAEIDRARMATLATGLDHFAARELAERCVVLWTNQYAEGPSHSMVNVPHIVWGSGGGYLRQGHFIDVAGARNNRLLNTLITAVVRDMGQTVDDFGEGTPGQLEEILA